MSNKKNLLSRLVLIPFISLIGIVGLSILTSWLNIKTNIDTGNVWALGAGWILLLIFFLALIGGGIVALLKLLSHGKNEKVTALRSLGLLGLAVALLYISAYIL